jgi:Flp pilus assembly protein TadD
LTLISFSRPGRETNTATHILVFSQFPFDGTITLDIWRPEGVVVLRGIGLVATFLAATLLWADPPSPSEIDQLVRQLGDKRFTVREEASAKLWKIGLPAEAALRKAAKDSSDVEITQRAKALLEKFAWGIFADTPEAVVAELERYREGDAETQRQAAVALADQGPAGFGALGRLRARATTDDERHVLSFAMTHATSKALPALLKSRDYVGLEALLEACLDHEADEALANYTALMILRGKLPAAIAKWQSEHSATPSLRASETLVYLHRAAGNLAEARRFATRRNELLNDVLWEQGDWAVLATRPPAERPRGFERKAALDHSVKAAYCRLARDQKSFAEQMEKLSKLEDPNDEWTIIKSLLLNERVTDAFDRLSKSPHRNDRIFDLSEVTFDLLVAQMRFREAFELARKVNFAEHDEGRRRFGIKHARALHLIGDRDAAGQLFAKIAGECKSPVDGETVAELIQTQSRLGLRDAARDVAANYLGVLSRQALDSASDPTRRVLEAVFPKLGFEAKTWWQFLRQKFPKEDDLAAMRRLRGLIEGGENRPADLAELVSGVIAAANDDDPNAAIQARLAAATALEAARQFPEAIAQLTDAASRSRDPDVSIRLGDLHASRRQYGEAETAYGKAATIEPTNPLPVYLQGWALNKAGKTTAGEQLIEQARLMSLGDARKRAVVAEELTKRNLLDLAQRERNLVLQLGWHRAWSAGGFLSFMGREAAARKEFARAADCFDRVIVGVLADDLQFIENSAYVTVPALARAYRARAALADSQLDAVRTEAEACLALTPGNIDLAILLVPELAKRGRGADADALYARAKSTYEELCQAHPTSAFAHNSAAWLAACCRRDLDAALTHAQKATELAPQFAGYRDTLAEVHFQRGDKAKAIALIKECQRMEPANQYFVKQLERFEAGDPSVPPPPENDVD